MTDPTCLRSLLEQVGDWVWECDLEGRMTYISESVEKFTGYRAEEVIGAPFHDRIHGVDAKEAETAFRQLVAAAQPFSRVQRNALHKSGHLIDVEINGMPLLDQDGRLQGFCGVTRDFTSQQRMLQELKESKQRLGQAQRIAHIGNWEFDLVNDSLYWSDEIYRIFEIDPDRFEATYEGFLQVVHPDDRSRVDRTFREAVERRQPYEVHHRLLMQDGRIKYVQEQCQTFYDEQDRPIRSIGTVQDVTRLTEAERRLSDSERRFRSLVEQSPLSIQIYSSTGEVLLANKAWERLWGTSAEQLAGYNVLRDSQLVKKGVMPYIERGFSGEALTTPAIIYDPSELPWVPREQANTERWIQSFIYPIKDERGEVVEVVLMHEDVTERYVAQERQKKIEQELSQYRERLEQLVIQRTAELKTANDELAAFSYSVSHDLRAPLRSIDGFSQALLEDYEAVLDDTGRDYLSRVRNATQRMGQLIDDLLMLSRLSRREMSCERIDLSALAEQAVEELREHQPQRRVVVEIEPQMRVLADAKLISIALSNLLGNAWKYTATRARPHIRVGCREENGTVAYFVRDNGVGFDMKYADKLFGAFQRLHKSSEFEGSGIGLATVARIIHRHGGKVWAEAKEDAGACFYFTLGEERGE